MFLAETGAGPQQQVDSLKLAQHFVEVCSNPGDTVLDPFVGSGTTLHACAKTGRVGIGIDVRPSQTALSRKRLRQVVP